MLDSARLLFDLQHVSQVVQAISGCLEARKISQHITDALVNQFDCVFARLWLMEVNQTALRLVASSGLHTHLDGSFARVPVGAYKVGKIAQNRVPFLSNHLADEPWVKDRDWAIANHIQGFAGYPLVANDRVIGVLATFSDQPMAPEFLEVLQVLCMTTTIALDAATRVEQSRQAALPAQANGSFGLALSDQMATALRSTCLTLVGTEHPLPATLSYTLLQAVEHLNHHRCNYCRLSYQEAFVALEAIIAVPADEGDDAETWVRSQFIDLRTLTLWLGGKLDLRLVRDRKAVQFFLEVPYPDPDLAIPASGSKKLSEREWEVMTLLAQGLRDRDIAQKLYISESTVKFHINNSLVKLNAKNRYQGVYQAAIQGCI
ncbi:MAG: GAF domain-containing protein [Leptolyngbya sp. SIO1E4]|nr:GAF domain-containing protein [Leptolyngbya sp. SIO1E4]